MKHLINYKIFESIDISNIVYMVLSDLDGEFDISNVLATECSYRSKKDGIPYTYPYIEFIKKPKPLTYFINKDVKFGHLVKRRVTYYKSSDYKTGLLISGIPSDIEEISKHLNKERFNSYNLDFKVVKSLSGQKVDINAKDKTSNYILVYKII